MAFPRFLSSLMLLAPLSAAAETLPAGEAVDEAAVVDLTPAGFDALTGVIPTLLPSGISVDPIGDAYEGLWGQCWLGGYEYALENVWISLSVDGASIIPRDGYLEIDLDIGISVNDPSDTFSLFTSLECIDDTCDGHVEPFTVSASTVVDLQVITGSDGLPAIDANVGDLSVSYTLSGDQIHLDNCAIGTVEDVLNFFGISIFDLILSFAGGFIDDAIAGFVPQIETLIEDATSGLYIEQELALGDASANLVLYPYEIRIRNEGMRFTMAGLVDAAEPAACIADVDPGGSYYIASDSPPIGSGPTGHHAGIFLSDEFGNQALYALWRAGLLCQKVDSELTGGFALDTNILGLLAADAFDPLFPEPSPLIIETRPDRPPELLYASGSDVVVSVEQLGLEFFAELDHRQTRIVGADLSAEIGLDLPFDGTAGTLGIELDLAGENFDTVVIHNEYVPAATADLEANFPGLVDTLVGPIVASMLGETSIALPALQGLGLTALSIDAAGDDRDWLGIYANVGTVSYEAAGCGDTSGGCGLGCGAAGPSPGRFMLFGLPLALLLYRRRSSSEA